MEATAAVRNAQLISPATEFTVARYALESKPPLSVSETLPFAEQVRRALISHRVETTHSEVIVGKTSEGRPLTGHLHAHYWATDEDYDGHLDHVTVYAPRGFDAEDIGALKALHIIMRFDQHWRVRARLVAVGRPASFDIPLFRASKIWRSVSPFSLPRFATRGAGLKARPRDKPEAQLARELRVRELPEPVSMTRINGYSVNDHPLVRWVEFQARRLKGETGHGLVGFEIEFAEEVQGPIAVGFGCHFGLGLFMPV